MQYNDYELIYMIGENEEALDCLLKKYEPLFIKLAKKYVDVYKYKGLDFDDIVQFCRITFCKVIDKFDPNRDVIFYTYLLVCLKRAVYNFCRTSIKKPDCYNYMDLLEYDNTDSFILDFNVYDNYIDIEFQEKIIDFKNFLDGDDAYVFELRYNGFSYKDIACLLDINVKRVDNILVKLRKKLEKYFLF